MANPPEREKGTPISSAPETEALRKDMEQLRKDLAALSDSVKRSSSEYAHAGMDAARDRFNDIRREAGRHTQELSGEIEARPFTSILAAFAAGLILGKIFSR